MISSPNRHSPIGIAARRFGFFSAGALTAMTSVYCRRCTELAQLHLWRRPFRHLKSENEHCVIPYPLTKLPSSAFGNSTCHMPPVDSAADARAGAGAGAPGATSGVTQALPRAGAEPLRVNRRRSAERPGPMPGPRPGGRRYIGDGTWLVRSRTCDADGACMEPLLCGHGGLLCASHLKGC
jgi:hypothetical protein